MDENDLNERGADNEAPLRPGETAVGAPPPKDAALYFIGRIRTPWRARAQCPRQGNLSGPVCRVEVDAIWRPALEGLAAGGRAQILYWMHAARRDLVRQRRRGAAAALGTFALRSPMRPNPIASSLVVIESVEAWGVSVRGLDCLDGTPLLDIKPDVCPAWGEQ